MAAVGKEKFRPTSLTLPMVILGLLLGSLVCLANIHFGLQVGSMDTMSLSTTLLSFAILKGCSGLLRQTFTPSENVVVQAIATSVAAMPITASFASIIPAYEFLRRPEEGGLRSFSTWELITWSLAVAFFGTVFAAPFRTHFLLRERLRFPGNYAVSVLLAALYQDRDVARNVTLDRQGLSYIDNNGDETTEGIDHSDDMDSDSPMEWISKIILIAKATGGTALYIVASYFVPMISKVPIFGAHAAQKWMWFLTLSPAYTSFGMILDVPVAVHMTVGAVVGWGFLSPLSKTKGWAPGPVDDMETGVRGWLLWVSIGSLLGDTMIRSLGSAMMFAKQFYRSLPGKRDHFDQAIHYQEANRSREPLLRASRQTASREGEEEQEAEGQQQRLESDQHEDDHSVSTRTFLLWLTASTCLCIGCSWMVFGQDISPLIVVAAIAVALPLCVVVLQASGETSVVPSGSLSNACQFLFVLLESATSSSRLSTMVASGITEAGLWQSAVMMGDLKVGYLVQAHPMAMYKSQLIGSSLGCLVGAGIYRYFVAAYGLPDARYPMPLAHMWVNTARLAQGKSLPEGAWSFMLAAFLLSALLRLVRASLSSKFEGSVWIPSGVAMSIGMFVPPSISLAKLIGAGLRLYLVRRWGVSEVSLMAAATGCILCEGTIGFIPGLLAAFGVPRLM